MSKYNHEWAEAWLSVVKPKPKLTGSEWADRYRYIAPGTTPEPGLWRTDRVPYLREPMDSATDSETEFIVLCCSSQVGKSECLMNIMGYYIDQDPAPMLMLQPTLGMAEAFSKERIDPTLQYSKTLHDRVTAGKVAVKGNSRKGSDTMMMKSFPGGYLALVGANSPAGLASRPIRVLLADETDRYTDTKEGDPLKLAIQRTTNFHNRKVVMVSTPTIQDHSTIDDWFTRSDQRRFFIPCPHCGHEEPWMWHMVKWDKGADGEADLTTCRMLCTECGKVIRGSGRPDPVLVGKGHWMPTAESAIKGYHLNSLISPWVSLDSLVDEFLHAVNGKDRRGLQEFINLKLGEPFEEDSFDEDLGAKAQRRREFYDYEMPSDAYVITAGCDVQRDRLECTVVAWGRGKESWILEHKIIQGDPQQALVWQELDVFLSKSRESPTLGKLIPSCVCIDSGDGTSTEMVYRYTKQREANRVFAIKGRGGFEVPFVSRPNRGNRYKALLYTLGVDAGKSLVYSRLSVDDEGPSYVHFPKSSDSGCDDEYFAQLGAEKLENKFEQGRLKRRWKKIRERNEALDCLVYATAAVEILGLDLDTYAEMMDKRVNGESPAPVKKRKFSTGVKW